MSNEITIYKRRKITEHELLKIGTIICKPYFVWPLKPNKGFVEGLWYLRYKKIRVTHGYMPTFQAANPMKTELSPCDDGGPQESRIHVLRTLGESRMQILTIAMIKDQ